MNTTPRRPVLASGILATVLAVPFNPASAVENIDPEIPVIDPRVRQADTPLRYGEERQRNSTAQQQPFQALPETEQESLWSAFAEARRAVESLTAHEAALPHNAGVSYIARNASQRITVRFLDGAARIESGREGGWAATLGLAESGNTRPVLADGRVEYRHVNGITEWYENRAEGLEHAFSVQRRPDEAEPELRLTLVLRGVKACLGEGEQAGRLTFADPATGTAVLNYGELKAWDATGRQLASRYETCPKGLDIVVADAGAVYPLTIDPLITSQETKLGPEVTGDGAQRDRFGKSVALSGDTALVGVPGDDTAAGNTAGSAYVFTRNGTVWSQQAKITAGDGADGDDFGTSVALSGDTALVGAPDDTPAGVRGSGVRTGSAYVFTRSGTIWSQQAKLTPGDAARTIRFGSAVALSGDTALVGTPFDYTTALDLAGSAYVFTRSGTVWSQQAKITAGDPTGGSHFGTSVAFSGDTALVGAWGERADKGRGSAYVFTRNGTGWSQQAKLTAGDGARGGKFGTSVALSEDTALVGGQYRAYVFTRSGTIWSQQAKLTSGDGAHGHDFGISMALSGDTALVGGWEGAYVFTRSGTIWSQQAKLTAGDETLGSKFGSAVALSGDTALVGAPDDDTTAGARAGSAFAFTRNGTGWSQQAKLTSGDGAHGHHFGTSVALFGDTVLVGTPYDPPTGLDSLGSAYVFTRNGTGWSQQAKLTAGDAKDHASFGTSVALSGDTVLIGAPGRTGSAYAFTRRGTIWSRQAKLTAGDGAQGNSFGTSVALSGDTALVGAPGGTGSAYAFTRRGTIWSQQAKLTAGDAKHNDCFGSAVVLSGDTALVGAAPALETGSAYVFTRRSGMIWRQQAKLIPRDAARTFLFGTSVALSGDTALVGTPSGDTTAGDRTGSTYVFTRNGTVWSQQAKLTAGDGTSLAHFGTSVALSGDTALVGTPSGNTTAGVRTGSAYVFTRNGTLWSQQAKITAGDGADGDEFGTSVALSEDTALVGAPLDDTPHPVTGDPRKDHGSIYLFRLVKPAPAKRSQGDQ